MLISVIFGRTLEDLADGSRRLSGRMVKCGTDYSLLVAGFQFHGFFLGILSTLDHFPAASGINRHF